ncbi:MAG TPA: hypothetical protein VGZ02_12430 [Candidatus Baltobacteraceae bacterium]|jgi:hypothetical protein|nr:hypothetical protein [Candidatus Baltobacteraceae bacterium]
MIPDERRYERFAAEFEPGIAALGKAATSYLRSLLPSADVMIYDNYNFLVAGFSPTERPSDAVLSVAMSARGVNLCFLQGASLPDPAHILRGTGKLVRNVRLEHIDDLRRPALAMLVDLAITNARVPFDPDRSGRFYVKSVSATKRPRRKGQTGK